MKNPLSGSVQNELGIVHTLQHRKELELIFESFKSFHEGLKVIIASKLAKMT